MIDGIRVKVCGLTSLVDAEFADRCGADFLGFNLHPDSPRYVSPTQYRALAPMLPKNRRVAVVVEPTPEALQGLATAGFDRFQIHFRHDSPPSQVQAWSDAVGAGRLWLAPKLPSGAPFAESWLPLAEAFLIDTYAADRFGGTGRTGDWSRFEQLRRSHPDRTWILAGGLNPENIGSALKATGARFLDVNSGIESAPGIKDHQRLKQFIAAIHQAKADAT